LPFLWNSIIILKEITQVKLFINSKEMQKSELYNQNYWEYITDIHGHFKKKMDMTADYLIKIKVF